VIEIVYTSNEKDMKKNNDLVRLPKNIKQIGDIKGSKKIYIEDYAINFINEAHLDENSSVFGVLVGSVQKSGSDRYIFIKGAIRAEDVFISETEIMVSDSDWTHIYETIGQYFTNQEIVGWFLSMDGINASTFRTIKKTHLNLFASAEKTLFIFDRQENEKYFCIYENEQLMRKKGYVIYYERNEEMQNYLVDQRNKKQIRVENVELLNNDISVEKNTAVKEQPHRNDDKAIGKVQSFVNYCANVAMVLLVLFIGVYLVNNRNRITDTLAVNETETTITSVIKIDGEVYPTTSEVLMTSSEVYQVQEQTTQNNETEETLPDEQQTENETTSEAYITVSNNVTGTQYSEHIVKTGDNLYTISKQYYGDYSKIAAIMELNGIENMDKIYIGQTIKLP
jgi:nucleoid-associated protein YgaU